ncbi:ABC transporter ATP-binding protein [Clostridium perfringens]|nr:ABC transporter ATP-binding protein [Clostridium perfringens]
MSKKEFSMIENILNNFLRVYKILKDINKYYVFIILIFAILLGVLPTISTILIQKLLNIIQSDSGNYNILILILFSYLMVDLVLMGIGNFKNYYVSIFQMKVNLKVNKQILEKASGLSLKHYEDTEYYNIIQRAQNQSGENVLDYFTNFVTAIQLIISFISISFILFKWKKWTILLIILVSISNSLLRSKISKEQYEIIRKRTGQERKKWYYQYLLTNDIAYKEINIYGLSQYFINKYLKLYNEFITQDKKILKKVFSIEVFISLCEQFVIGFLFVYIIISTMLKKILMGDTVAYIKSISNIQSSIQGLMSQIVKIYKDTLYMNQLFEFLDIEIKNEDNNNIEIGPIRKIELKNLSYKYRGTNKYVLKDINLVIEENTTIAIVGKNGSGKTTLVKILAGFYDDYEGEIYINGYNLRDINKSKLKEEISILFQDYNKYELTIRENVALGKLKYLDDDNKIKDIMNKMKVEPNLCDSLDSQLGFWFDNGVQLSGGQWLKLSICRSFIRGASLCILDEPNAALDVFAERVIMQNLKELTKDKISIIITHRIHNIKLYSDKIIVISEGEVVADGGHEELIENCNIYKKFHMNSLYMEI